MTPAFPFQKIIAQAARMAMMAFAIMVLSGCSAATALPAPETVVVEVTRVVSVPSTPEQIEVTRAIQVTRVVQVTRQVEVTATPKPGPAYDCYQTAMTSTEINGCAALHYDLALKELARTTAQIMAELSADDQKMLQEIQADWQAQIERDCDFFYGQLIHTSDGGLFYKNGSMAPMLVSGCKAEMTEQRNQELREAYLCDDFHCGED